jgi:hypothetical protein
MNIQTMHIQTVKNRLDGMYDVVFVGDIIVYPVPNDPSNRHCQEVQEWIAEGNIPGAADALPDPTWQEKRQADIAGGGYGAWTEQLEIIGEQGITAFQDHIAAVKLAHPKP